MNNSVIETLNSRIEFYTKSAGLDEKKDSVEIKENKKVVNRFIEDQSLFNTLEVTRLLELLKIKMGEKRTTVTLYIEQDIGNIKNMLSRELKNNGRGFVDKMKDINMQRPMQDTMQGYNQMPSQDTLEGGNTNSMSKSYVKTKTNGAHYIFPAA